MENRLRFLWSGAHELAGQAAVARTLMRCTNGVAGTPTCPVSLQTRSCLRCATILTPAQCTVRSVSRHRLKKRRRGRKSGRGKSRPVAMLAEYQERSSKSYIKVHCRVCYSSFLWSCTRTCKPPSTSLSTPARSTTQVQQRSSHRKRHSQLKWRLQQQTPPTATPTPSLADFLV